MAFSKIDLNKIISSAEFQRKLDVIRGIGEHRLREAIWDTVYESYSPVQYIRTYELLNSVSSSFKYNGDFVEIKVFCDPDKMHHYSVVDGNPTFVPPIINNGFFWPGWGESEPDYFHNRPESRFLEEAMEEIQKDMQKSLLQAVIVAFNSNRYR